MRGYSNHIDMNCAPHPVGEAGIGRSQLASNDVTLSADRV